MELVVRLPMRVRLNGSAVREVLLVEGPAGWGECSPLPGYPCAPERARAAADEAAFHGWPPPVREVIPVNALIPALPPDEARAAAAAAVSGGYRCLKVKVGTGDDVSRVSAVREAAGPAIRIRVDANGAWDIEQAVVMIDRLARFDLELVEQPVETLEDLAAVRRRVRVPVAADESVRSVDDARRLARLEAADVVVLKVQPLGGVLPALAVAEAAGVPGLVTSMMETSVGLAAGLALAAALPELDHACGLATAGFLLADVVADPLLAVDGAIALRRPVPDPGLLERYRMAA
ncbi:MAG: o-succinylbenzoate synthase [Acidimicrobiales bacterium]|nr:o-succinylbenzoate synthase [Actinomycetota bacterium]